MKALYYFSCGLLLFSLLQCKRRDKKEKPSQNTMTLNQGTTSLTLKNPQSYCEKTFFCSYSTLVSDNAKRILLHKKKAFLATCDAALAQMPKQLSGIYSQCINKPCGKELRECIVKLGGKELDALQKKTAPAPVAPAMSAVPGAMGKQEPTVKSPTPKISTQKVTAPAMNAAIPSTK
ncbi:hypothetical protein KKF84_18730 [Myxococcota bacterium]|nr:hypothetical protein [Myxococcota bacterium]